MWPMATGQELLTMFAGPIGPLTADRRLLLLRIISFGDKPSLARFLTQNNPILQPTRVTELVEQLQQTELGRSSAESFEDRARIGLLDVSPGSAPAVIVPRVTVAAPTPQIQIQETVVEPMSNFWGFEDGGFRGQMGSDVPEMITVGLSPIHRFPPAATVPASGGAIVISSTNLAARLGGSVGPRFIAWASGAMGARLAWQSLPSWLRSAMALIGLSGATILVDNATEGPIQLPGLGGGGDLDIRVGRFYDGRIITRTWTANGIQFWATGTGKDRMHHVLKLDGSIKSWKPPRPVVLMPGGAKNMRDLLRADDIVDRQLKKVAKALRRRSPTTRRPRSPQQVVIVDPQHAALHS